MVAFQNRNRKLQTGRKIQENKHFQKCLRKKKGALTSAARVRYPAKNLTYTTKSNARSTADVKFIVQVIAKKRKNTDQYGVSVVGQNASPNKSCRILTRD
jgi:hypothetical protein